MGKNTKPMLTVLVEENKLQQLRDYALSKEVSMGHLVNKLIDRLLSGELDVLGDGLSSASTYTGITREAVEALINDAIASMPIGVTRDYLEEYTNSIIGKSLVTPIDISDIEKLVNTSIDLAVEPISTSIIELETYTRGKFEELETRSIGAPVTVTVNTPIPAKNTDEGNKSWAEFFKMVGIDAITATEAQKKENIEIRTKQIEAGVLAAKDKGFGEWAVKVAGRSFVRVGD
jgi:hypothetical protein